MRRKVQFLTALFLVTAITTGLGDGIRAYAAEESNTESVYYSLDFENDTMLENTTKVKEETL